MISEFSKNKPALEAITAHLEKLTSWFPGMIYSYAIISKRDPTNILIISNKPEWFDEYVNQNYQLIDPVTTRALNDMGDFSWERNSHEITSTNLQKVFRTSEKVHIDVGHTFILHDPRNNVVTLTIMTGLEFYGDLIRLLEENGDKMPPFLISTHKKTLSIYDKLIKKDNTGKVSLTKREYDILQLASKGKKYSEIAVILDLAVSTVKFHISKITRKLGAKNIPHAINLAVELKLISNEP